MKIFISGQKYFGMQVLRLCIEKGFDVVGVCCPVGDKYIGRTAATFNIPIIPSGLLNGDTFPDGVDLGITAHSFDYIGTRTRYKTKLGWIGYHPSLLPRHRGRSSIEWALRMNDPITGGTVFWLNSGIDRGDIERQEFIWLDHKKSARQIWQDELCPLGLKLIGEALDAIAGGVINKTLQDPRFSTFEPSLDNIKDIFKPDLLMLESNNS
jgi:methionyl-tRNA formyltransferase